MNIFAYHLYSFDVTYKNTDSVLRFGVRYFLKILVYKDKVVHFTA